VSPGREQLLVRGQAPLRARLPGELLEQQLAAAPPHPRGQRAVRQQLRDAVPGSPSTRLATTGVPLAIASSTLSPSSSEMAKWRP
jgi:hypothetical protein